MFSVPEIFGWLPTFLLVWLCLGAGAGCGGSGGVVAPAQETAANWSADTLQLPAPPPLESPGSGRPALPATVEHHAPIFNPSPFSVTEIELGGDTLTVRSPRVTRHFAAPAAGETLRVRRESRAQATSGPDKGRGASADSAASPPRVTGRVDGRPQPDTVRPSPEEEEPEASVFEKLAGLPAWGLALLVLAGAGVLIFFFRIFAH